jgi:hypothetical protein
MRAPVAQRIRASVFGTEGRGFESHQARQYFKLPNKGNKTVSHLLFIVSFRAEGGLVPPEIPGIMIPRHGHNILCSAGKLIIEI